MFNCRKTLVLALTQRSVGQCRLLYDQNRFSLVEKICFSKKEKWLHNWRPATVPRAYSRMDGDGPFHETLSRVVGLCADPYKPTDLPKIPCPCARLRHSPVRPRRPLPQCAPSPTADLSVWTSRGGGLVSSARGGVDRSTCLSTAVTAALVVAAMGPAGGCGP